LLASYADILWTRRQRIVLARPEWHRGPGPSFIVGSEKHALLRSSRTLLNLHREGATGLEWVRVIEAICNGAVVITEHSHDHAPLVPGEHFVSGRAPDLALLADLLLNDEERLAAIRQNAHEFIREAMPLERSTRCSRWPMRSRRSVSTPQTRHLAASKKRHRTRPRSRCGWRPT
jgi:hypothetical protein